MPSGRALAPGGAADCPVEFCMNSECILQQYCMNYAWVLNVFQMCLEQVLIYDNIPVMNGCTHKRMPDNVIFPYKGLLTNMYAEYASYMELCIELYAQYISVYQDRIQNARPCTHPPNGTRPSR